MNLPALLPEESEWKFLKEQAVMAVRSGLLPAAIDTPEKATIIALKGRELGLPPMLAYSQINVIKGKPAASAELMLALVYKNVPGAVIQFTELTNEVCRITASRGNGLENKFEFTIKDAAQAGLLNNNTWKAYPRAMLRSRCVSEMCRSLFPDAVMGLSYTPEELGADVNEDGQIKDINPVDTNDKTLASRACSEKTEDKKADHKTDGPDRRKQDSSRNVYVQPDNELPETTKKFVEKAKEVFHAGPPSGIDPKYTDYVIPFGMYTGKRFSDISVNELKEYLEDIFGAAKRPIKRASERDFFIALNHWVTIQEPNDFFLWAKDHLCKLQLNA